ncbi:MAG: hypothetical protein RLZZ21_1405 [Planctomycetota bacterium]|jgi:hypothetical protein
MASPRKVAFTEDAAQRIAAATLAYERGNRDMPPIHFRTGGDDGGDEPRLGTISATWNKGSTATVTQIKADGTTLSPTVQFQATNHFATITITSGTRKVLCVFVGDRWLLVAAEC